MHKLFKKHLFVFQKIAIFSDTFLICSFFPIAVSIIRKIRYPGFLELTYLLEYTAIPIVSTIVLIFLLYKNNSYDFSNNSVAKHFTAIVKCIIPYLLTLAFILFILNYDGFSRAVLLTYVALSIIGIFLKRMLDLLILKKAINFIEPKTILIIGTGKHAEELAMKILNERLPYIYIIGYLSWKLKETKKDIKAIPILGRISDLVEICKTRVVDEVMIVEDEHTSLLQQKNIILLAEQMGINVNIYSDSFNSLFSKLTMETIQDINLLVYNTTTLKHFQLFVKYVSARIIAFIAIMLFSPLMLLIALAIKLTSPGPVIYKSTRITKHGRSFSMFKFRSMRVHPDIEFKKLIKKHRNDSSKNIFKIKNDPRITFIGKIIRKLSLDELPQLFNILKGEMSFVGPRPLLPSDVEVMEPWHRRFLSMKPGLTCLWQISGRSKIASIDEKIKLDLKYIDNWSLLLDFIILIKTIPVVLFGWGAE